MTGKETIKDRLKAFVKHLKISERVFEINCNLSNGYIYSMKKGVGHDKIELISNFYPELNTGWLLTGEGDMLRTDQLGIIPTNLKNQEEQDDYIHSLDLKIELQREVAELKKLRLKIESLESVITRLEARIENKDEQLDILIRKIDKLTDEFVQPQKGNAQKAAKNV